MSQFRQFWIWGFKFGPDESISQNCSVHLDKGGSEWYDPVHHVIEYSAYEAAQREIENLKKENEEIKIKMSGVAGATVGSISKEYISKIEQLTAALKVAENAIEREMRWRTVKYCTNDGLDNLGEALAEIQIIKKELG